MFQVLTEKIMIGVLTLSMALFSDFKGNSPSFHNVFAAYSVGGIYIYAELKDSFENDFEDIFTSGQLIHLSFELKIFADKELILEETFRHAVLYDPLQQEYTIFLEESNQQLNCREFSEAVEFLSKFEYNYKLDSFRSGHIRLSCELPKIRMGATQKEYDLMMLWNFKKPKIRIDCAESLK